MWHVAWTYLTAAALLGWATTALFCAVAGTALAIWARLPWALGFVAGLVTLGVGVVVLAVVGGVGAASRRGGGPPARRPRGPPPRLAGSRSIELSLLRPSRTSRSRHQPPMVPCASDHFLFRSASRLVRSPLAAPRATSTMCCG